VWRVRCGCESVRCRADSARHAARRDLVRHRRHEQRGDRGRAGDGGSTKYENLPDCWHRVRRCRRGTPLSPSEREGDVALRQGTSIRQEFRLCSGCARDESHPSRDGESPSARSSLATISGTQRLRPQPVRGHRSDGSLWPKSCGLHILACKALSPLAAICSTRQPLALLPPRPSSPLRRASRPSAFHRR